MEETREDTQNQDRQECNLDSDESDDTTLCCCCCAMDSYGESEEFEDPSDRTAEACCC